MGDQGRDGAIGRGEVLTLLQRSARRREYELRRDGALLGWLDSPEHRANLFKPEWTDQGIALVYVPDFRGVANSRIWVSHFGHQG
jgi:uncharacterized protein YkwD